MHQKALLFGDEYQASKIMEKSHPRDQKAAGRCVTGFDVGKWNAVARDIVYKGNYAKFTQNHDLLQKLGETAGTELVEASPYDTIWGIGISCTPFNISEGLLDRKNWKGTNWLGEVLTKLRDDLKDGIQRTEGFNWS